MFLHILCFISLSHWANQLRTPAHFTSCCCCLGGKHRAYLINTIIFIYKLTLSCFLQVMILQHALSKHRTPKIFLFSKAYADPTWSEIQKCSKKLLLGADATYKELLDKRWTQNVANNINYRHRMAQYASRASVNLHTHIFFKNQVR